MTTTAEGAVSLLEGVSVHGPGEDGYWTVKRADGKYLRVGADMGRFLAELRAATRPSELGPRLGDPWGDDDVARAIEMAAQMSLVGDASAERREPEPRRSRRVTYIPPLTVQFTILRAERVADRARPALQAVPRWGLRMLAAFPVLGIIALALLADSLAAALSEPVSVWVLCGVALASVVGMSLHELGHGAALTRHGGTPSRIGFMLFYLSPAMFCDVTDGWLLPRSRQRVSVALAGVGTQAVIGGTAAVAAAVVDLAGGSRDAIAALLVIAVSNYIAGVINLTPLVKFDGYIALMVHLDIPYLRKRAIASLRDYAVWLLFGARRPASADAGRRWLPWFGLGSAVFPIVLVVSALSLWGSILTAFGLVGRVVLAFLVVVILLVPALGLARVVRHARAAGARWSRVACGLVITAAAVAAVVVVPVPDHVTGGYYCTDDGSYLLLDDFSEVAAGDAVTLQSRGVLLANDRGTAFVADNLRPREVAAPFTAFVPITGFGFSVPSAAVELDGCATGPGAVESGKAVVDIGSVSLAQQLVRTYFLPLFH